MVMQRPSMNIPGPHLYDTKNRIPIEKVGDVEVHWYTKKPYLQQPIVLITWP